MKLGVVCLLSLGFLAGCGGGGGGGIGAQSCVISSPLQYCQGSGSFYYCTPVGGSSATCSSGSSGSSSAPEPQPRPFATGTAMANIVSQVFNVPNMKPSPFTPTPDVPSYGNQNQDSGRQQVPYVQIIKTPSSDTFHGTIATKQTTIANWSGVILASDYQGWYPTPYQLYFNAANDLVGFSIAGRHGKRSGGISMPASVSDQGTGQIGQFDVFSDSALTTRIGSALLTYRVNNCCDLYNKEKANLILELTGSTSTGTFTLTQSYVILVDGSVRSFGSESFNNGGVTRNIALTFNGY